MGLDAVVWCDCYENGRLRELPLPNWRVRVHPDTGERDSECEILEEQMAFDQWNASACEHEFGVFEHQYLGNIASIGHCCRLLSPHAVRLPILLEKVIYSPTHCGDHLCMDDVRLLESELTALAEIQFLNGMDQGLIRRLESQLFVLTKAAITLGKPICF